MTSDWVVVKKGCPQRSTFGPLVWNIFQNDMPNIISDANVSMYANDHRIFVAKETMKSVEKILVENGERMTKGTKEIFWKSISSYGFGKSKRRKES